MIEQNFKSQRYELKQFKGEHIEVAFAGNKDADKTIVFIHGAMMTYRIMLLFEPYFRDNNRFLLTVQVEAKALTL